jgi:hypothetical protein
MMGWKLTRLKSYKTSAYCCDESPLPATAQNRSESPLKLFRAQEFHKLPCSGQALPTIVSKIHYHHRQNFIALFGCSTSGILITAFAMLCSSSGHPSSTCSLAETLQRWQQKCRSFHQPDSLPNQSRNRKAAIWTMQS